MDNRPIGIFDSGLGGLTVLKEMRKQMPNEEMIYFGDCGRVPYGTKSKETVIKYTFQDIRFLLEKGVKMIVVGCNTASASAFDIVKKEFDIPVVEVIEPGSRAALRETKNRKIGVIGTWGTINSQSYVKTIRSLDKKADIFSVACPLFVPLAEEGWWNDEIALKTAEKYLGALKQVGIDALVLGCTHYPLLKKTIAAVMGKGVKLVNSGFEVAKVAKDLLRELDIETASKSAKSCDFYTSDSVEKFEELGSSFLGEKICSASKIDIEKY